MSNCEKKQNSQNNNIISTLNDQDEIYSFINDNYTFFDKKLKHVIEDDTKIPLILVACGSFSPITYLHLRMFEIAADHVREKTNMEILGGYYSPVADGYKKIGLIESHHRVKMCELACEETSTWLMVDSWEALQKRHTRTSVVLDHFNYEINDIRGGVLTKEGGKKPVKIMLLVGSDMLQSMVTLSVWAKKDLHHIFGNYGCFVIERPGFDMSNNKEINTHAILSKYKDNIILAKQFIYNDISSTKIRFCIKNNLSIKCLLPNSVVEYIHKNGLYLE
ncbi:hypothetical protein PORY_001499 [Pneumocystis oryctolagi]|uniref:Uncharacterized protein n=1 Tax=Pneumocystis oryctolagi TaxID=42067 RepID=A0ACB7CIA2_9ASCO|nr:hypothetical protein PORY_001499 [Pneumocystis oryctolagi]